MQFNRSRPIPRCFRWCYKVLSARLSIRWVSLRHTEQVENVVRTGFPDVSMSLLIMKCFRYFISVNGLSVQRGTGGVRGGGVRLLWKEGREALSRLLSVRLVRCAPLKGYIGWSELEFGRGGWRVGVGGVIINNQCQCISRCYRRYGRSVHHPSRCAGWLDGKKANQMPFSFKL